MTTEPMELWGYVEGDARLVGAVVAVVGAAAVVWLVRRIWPGRGLR